VVDLERKGHIDENDCISDRYVDSDNIF